MFKYIVINTHTCVFESNRAVVYSNMINRGQFKNNFIGQTTLMNLFLY